MKAIELIQRYETLERDLYNKIESLCPKDGSKLRLLDEIYLNSIDDTALEIYYDNDYGVMIYKHEEDEIPLHRLSVDEYVLMLSYLKDE